MAYKDPQAKRDRHREYMRERYQNDPEHRERHKARVKKNDRRYRAQADELIAEFRSPGCCICGESESCTLAAHHVDPSLKEFTIANGRRFNGVSIETLQKELDKCVPLCHNCHAKFHAGIVQLP